MKIIKLTQNKHSFVDDDDFDYLSQFNWFYTSGKNNGYAVRNGKAGEPGTVRMHREILKAPKGLEVDHINGDKLDNRKENLRACTKSQNQHNRKLNSNSKSGVKGVSWKEREQKWYAQIQIENKGKSLGYYLDKEEATNAYKQAELKYQGVI